MTFTFTLASPGTKILTHQERPIITLHSAAPPTTGKLPRMEKVRCDSVRGISTAAGGCVHARATPVFTLHLNDPRISEAAAHVRDAQLQLRGHPGLRGQGQPLHRTMDKTLIAKNRARACPSSAPATGPEV
ncbi:hypothetical protein ACN2WE_40695 [Streptomyces sp. cg28]|uniref:hypothetical protein n=1 Tax=Streptomyces sp. cg28 TaxID=3403457 RepID=UPI003B2109BC